MDETASLDIFSALAQGTRLQAFQLLVQKEPEGLAAGEISSLLGVPHNTLSTHLAILERAGLVSSERHGRNVTYRARLEAVRDIVMFLLKDCCGGRPEVCAPLIADLTPCCKPTKGRSRG